MNFRKVRPILVLLASTSLLCGCAASAQENYEIQVIENEQAQEQVQIVKVQSIEGNTVTAVIGELIQNDGPPALPEGEDATGDEPPALPEGEGVTGEAPPALPEGEDATGEAAPALPEGEDATGEAPPALPEGEGVTGDEPPALPEGEGVTGDEPPALPEGEDVTGEAPPALPDGEGQDGQVPEGDIPSDKPDEKPDNKPDGQFAGDQGTGSSQTFNESEQVITFTIEADTEITIEMVYGEQDGELDNIGINDVLEVTLNADGVAETVIVKNLTAGGGFGGSGVVTHGTSVTTIDTDGSITDAYYTSVGDDENALRVDGAKVELDDIVIEKLEGESSNTEDGDFYGQNAAFLAMDGAEVTIQNATVNTATTNGNGIFSYGEGTVVTVSDTIINTSGNNSGGIQITGGGTMNATNLEVETRGNSAAAIRSDRGGGTVNVVGGTYITHGTGSPSIYSTADISVADATLEATNSEAIVIEGKNSVALENCDLVGNMVGSHLEDTDNIQNIMIYQSMSGDAEIGQSAFSAKGGSITSRQGDMIYVTNTSCIIELSEVELILANEVLLKVVGNESSKGWGTQGSNGGNCIFIATNQVMDGKIIVDEISTLDMTLEEGTIFIGSINEEGEAGEVKVSLDAESKWVLDSDSYITEFEGDISSIEGNGYKVYVGGQAIN